MTSPRPGELPGLVAAFWLPSNPGMFVWQDVAASEAAGVAAGAEPRLAAPAAASPPWAATSCRTTTGG